MDMEQIKRVGIAAAVNGGKVLTEHFGNLKSIRKKEAIDLVTEADLKSEAAIIDTIAQTFPDHAILAEERGTRTGSDCRWIIDPLDGTTNFVHNLPLFCISIAFELEGHTWVAERMREQRAQLMGRLYGAAYPLYDSGHSAREERAIRADIAAYCLAQATLRKPYNLNLLNPHTDSAFYCSQLAYRAYLRHGIDLNSEQGVPRIKLIEPVIFPQEIWSGCSHQSLPSARQSHCRADQMWS